MNSCRFVEHDSVPCGIWQHFNSIMSWNLPFARSHNRVIACPDKLCFAQRKSFKHMSFLSVLRAVHCCHLWNVQWAWLNCFYSFDFSHPSASLFEVRLQEFWCEPIMFVRSGIYTDRAPVVQVVAIHNFGSWERFKQHPALRKLTPPRNSLILGLHRWQLITKCWKNES